MIDRPIPVPHADDAVAYAEGNGWDREWAEMQPEAAFAQLLRYVPSSVLVDTVCFNAELYQTWCRYRLHHQSEMLSD